MHKNFTKGFDILVETDIRIWIWIQDCQVFKAKCDLSKGIFIVYNEEEKILIKKAGLNENQISKIEDFLIKSGAKRLDHQNTPFMYI